LAEGYPIIFGINLYKSFDKQRQKGVVPMPSDTEASRASHGGHAMLAVGYSDKDRVFIVRNSWGEGWGDKGYCYIPYDYLINPKFNSGDSWIIKQLDNIDFDNQKYWDEGDESVLDDYDSEMANMSEEDYAAMLDAMGDYSFEYRLALFFLHAANADGDLTDEEYDAISVYMTDTLAKLGVTDMSAGKILRHAVRDIENVDLLQESVNLFKEYSSSEMLAKITSDIQSVVSIDGLSDYENSSIFQTIESWQIEESSESEESEEEEVEEEVAEGEDSESEESEEEEEEEEEEDSSESEEFEEEEEESEEEDSSESEEFDEESEEESEEEDSSESEEFEEDSSESEEFEEEEEEEEEEESEEEDSSESDESEEEEEK
jgi:hypothetical protein